MQLKNPLTPAQRHELVVDPVLDWSTSVGGSYNENFNCVKIDPAGLYVYVADDFAGLQIIDVTNPAAPIRVGGYDTIGTAYGVAVSGRYAYVADDEAGLQVIDVSNPAAPVRSGGYDTTGYAYGVAVSGQYVYVADGEAGLQVIDAGNPAAPVHVGVFATSGTAWGVALSGHIALVVDGDSGLQVIDVSNPAVPVRVGSYDTSGFAEAVAVLGNYVFVADNDWGLAILQLLPAQPATRVLLSWPASESVFRPVSATHVDGPWFPVTGSVAITGGQNQMPAGAVENTKFFRLQGGFGDATLLGPPISFPDSRERGPSLSTDGLSLYYCSDALGHMDLLVTTRASLTSPWGSPVRLEAINTPGDEVYPALSVDGLSLFFSDRFFLASERPGNFGGADLWVSERASLQGPWQPPVNLGPVVNGTFFDTTPAISSDGRTLLFASFDRPGIGEFDLWITTRSDAADPLGWEPPVNLGAPINSIYHDVTPNLSRDGLTLYFSSDRPSPGRPDGLNNLWVARRKTTSEPFGTPVSLGANFTNFDGMFDPYLSADGSTLFFMSPGLLSDLAPAGSVWQVPVLNVPSPPLSISLIATPSQP